MATTGIRDLTLGVGHLRRQVGFYTSNFGLRVVAKGRVPARLARDLWGHDDDLDVVTLGRPDLADAARLRLVRTSDLPARPDFDPTTPGPLGVVFTTPDIRRLYYRLSGAGVEFHAPPAEVAPYGEPGPGHPRFTAYGRAYDGEYLVLAEGAEGAEADGTVSPYFGVSEPRELCLVVTDLDAGVAFAERVFGFELLIRDRRGGPAREESLGLAPGTRFELAMLRHPTVAGARLTLYSFGAGGPAQSVARPPDRGLSALRVDCDDLDQRIAEAEAAGGRRLGGPTSFEEPALGHGWVATIEAPFGLLVELWHPL